MREPVVTHNNLSHSSQEPKREREEIKIRTEERRDK
jgi:hypothetical protein